MNFPALITSEPSNLPLFLIVDKIGVIGEALAKEFSKDYLVVFVSPNKPSEENKNIIHIPFKRKIPEVPDNNYSKIFILDDGQSVTRRSIFSFISKAREANITLYFIGSIRNIDIGYADEVAKSYSNSKVLIFGDLFDKKIFFDKDSSISRFILQSRKNLKIEVPGNGLSLSFPISFGDTIKLIVKASHVDISQKIILLFYPHPITDISLANTFKKINPDIKVDFVKEKKEKKIYIPNGGQHAISKYDLEEKIRELGLEDVENRDIKVVTKDNGGRRNFIKPIILFFALFLFLMFLPFITMTFYSFLGERQINNAKTIAEKGDFSQALKKANNSKTFFETAEKTSKIVTFQLGIIHKEQYAKSFIKKIEAGKTMSIAGIYILEGSELFGQIYQEESKDPKNDFSKVLNSFKSGVALIQKTRAEGNLSKELEKNLESIEPFIDLFSNSSDVLIDVLGFEKEKGYLVIFQNNMEIRPGGGLIGSFGILKIKDGKLKDFSTQSTYEVDKKLKAHVEPPYPIRRYLPSENLYLRDSNFDPDFVNSAISASNMYLLETGEKVDGVIGVDLAFAKNILLSLGEVMVPDYNKKVNADNLYKVVQGELEKGSSADSPQKKDFISQLAKSIELSFKKRNISYKLLAESIGKSIKEKHLLFAFQDTSVQNIFTANGWSSSLWDQRVNGKNLINDYLGIVEANLGENSVNYFVSRSVSKKIIIFDDGRVASKITIGFKNNSSKENKLGGNYKNYLQIVLPEGSKITSVAIDNKEVEVKQAVTDYRIYESRNFKPPAGLELEEKKQMRKSVFGFLISVGPKEVKNVTISYDLPYSIQSSQKSINYGLRVYKQPGIESYPMDLSFSIPFTFRLVDGKEFYSQEIKSDENLNFKIVQN